MDVTAWLLDSDPAVRWQALRDLTDSDDETIGTERARVARQGLGAAILAHQSDDGAWRVADEPDWVPTLYMAQLLRATGVDPADPAVDGAMTRLGDGFRWHVELGGKSFFDGETEPCINGGALAVGGYFGRPSVSLARRLLDEQLADGGWNCEAPKSARSSFHSTICVLEGLLEYERAVADAPASPSAAEVAAARRRGEEYLYERGLFRRRSTGEIADASFLSLSFPTRYRYHVLRALDYLRAAGVAPDRRVADAIGVIEQKRRPDGTWRLDATHLDGIGVALGETVGEPSRFVTLRALRVLRWYERAR